MFKKYIFAVLAVVLVMQLAIAQTQRDNTTRREAKESEEVRPEGFGIGLSAGLHKFGGDIQDGGTFPGAETPWKIGGNLHVYLRLGRIGDNFTVISLMGRVGYHPQEGKYNPNANTEFSFKDNVMQFSLGLQAALFPKSDIRPFAQVGVGFISFKPEVTTQGLEMLTRYNAFKGTGTSSGAFFGSAGLLYDISESMDIFASFEKTLTFTDNIDEYVSNIKDNWGSVNLGLMLYFGREEKKVEEVPPPPVVTDTDGDGLLDTDEQTIYKTDHRNKDTDGDKLIDGDEVKTYKTDPLNKDTDGDRLIDGDEVLTHKTNPLKKDTDGDGCIDGDEVLDMKTNPLKTDTDGDELSDCDERNIYKTNPLIVDTDGDGVNDGREVKNGTDPLKADVLKVTESGNIVLEGITFETNKAIIRPESEETLIKAYNTLKAYPEIKVEIQGHTDDVGKDAANQKLSDARAKSVMQWLIAKGVSASRMTAKGLGEMQPRVPNTSAENRAMNRRIEFKLVK